MFRHTRGSLAATKLGYHPNVAARSLASRKSFTIGLVVRELEYLSYREFSALLSGLAHRLSLDRFSVVPLVSDPAWEDQYAGLHYRARASSGSVDGLVLHDHMISPEDYDELEARGIPFVSVDAPVPGKPDRWLPFDHEGQAAWAVRHLVAHGFHRLIFLDPAPYDVESHDRAWSGFAATASALGREVEMFERVKLRLPTAENWQRGLRPYRAPLPRRGLLWRRTDRGDLVSSRRETRTENPAGPGTGRQRRLSRAGGPGATGHSCGLSHAGGRAHGG